LGNIRGIGNGSYQTATWHLSGTNGSHGSFDCDVSMTTTEFAVRITGHGADGRMHVRFALEGAHEANDGVAVRRTCADQPALGWEGSGPGEPALASVPARAGREAEVLVHGGRPAPVPAHQVALPDRHAAVTDDTSGAVGVVSGHHFPPELKQITAR
jgi:hypothetical protein